MKKSILLVMTILIATFGMITNVNAETCVKQYYDGLYTSINQSATLQLGKNEFFKTFYQNQIINFGNINYIKGQIYYVITNTNNNSIVSNINLETTCSSEHLEDMAPTMIITYADGSTARVNGSTYETICDSYITRNVNTTITITNNFEPNIQKTALYLIGNGRETCNIDNNGNFNCLVNNNTNYSGLIYQFYLEKSNSATIQYGLIDQTLQLCTNDTQEIINNQNQNTTTISNNITNLNDNIINSSISSQTTSDVGNISSNNINTDSKNVVLDFMLMPITFLNNILNSFSNNCATLCLGNCNSGHDNEWYFIFPCVDIKSFIGDTIYNTIDVLMCFGMIFAFLRSVVNFLKKALMLESDISSEVRIF